MKGFVVSFLDTSVPHSESENVIVVWSLVPNAVAQRDGRLLPGDRLVSVNNINFRRTSLDTAIQVLKHIPKGTVRLGVAKPTALSRSLSVQIPTIEKIEPEPEPEEIDLNHITNGDVIGHLITSFIGQCYLLTFVFWLKTKVILIEKYQQGNRGSSEF